MVRAISLPHPRRSTHNKHRGRRVRGTRPVRTHPPLVRRYGNKESSRSEPRSEQMAQPVAIEDQQWRHKARCRGLDPNLFFAERGNHHSLFTAMEVCNGDKKTEPCPVRTECLEFALTFPNDEDTYGVYGGMSPNARNKIRIARRDNGTYVQRTSIAKELQSLRGREPKPR